MTLLDFVPIDRLTKVQQLLAAVKVDLAEERAISVRLRAKIRALEDALSTHDSHSSDVDALRAQVAYEQGRVRELEGEMARMAGQNMSTYRDRQSHQDSA